MDFKTSFWRTIVKNLTKECLASRKNHYFIRRQISTYLRENENSFAIRNVKEEEIRDWLSSEGLLVEIDRAIRRLRNEKILIVSSEVKGKGYTMLDPNNDRTIEQWRSKFDARLRYRKEIPKQEKINDDQLFAETYKKCTEPQIRKNLWKLATQYKVKVPK